MNELRSVVNLTSYGNISIHLKELIEDRGITRYRLAKLADTRFEVVEKWCSAQSSALILICSPGFAIS